ncbi:hypothetical protein ACFXOD_35545 [Streptomyces sp. NPDC059161]|uniref:hypothetical protein n=1 Tax=Streptomyces sp. NPDC059161 TaxID=3346749 RepID=UPI0036CFBE1A
MPVGVCQQRSSYLAPAAVATYVTGTSLYVNAMTYGTAVPLADELNRIAHGTTVPGSWANHAHPMGQSPGYP